MESVRLSIEINCLFKQRIVDEFTQNFKLFA